MTEWAMAGAGRARPTGSATVEVQTHHGLGPTIELEPKMPRVLVVEDVDGKREQLSASLRLAGFDVSATTSAAVTDASLVAIDLVIIDLMLHGTNGFDLARRLRSSVPCLRVVLTSEYHFTEHQLARVDCGAIGFVPQPFELDELADFLRAKLAPPLLSLESERRTT